MDGSGDNVVYMKNSSDLIGNGYTYQNITTQTTTTLKSGSGLLKKIIINTPVALGVITIYDNTAASGTKIGTLTLPAALLSTGATSLDFGINFTTGLTIVTSGATMDITAVYK